MFGGSILIAQEDGETLSVKSGLVWRWSLHMVDDDGVHGTFAWHEFQAKLLFKCGKD
jgi:hypothetical protein